MDSLVTRAASLGHPIQRRQPSWRSSDDALEPLLGGISARSPSIWGLQLFDPRTSRVVKATEVVTEWLDASYSAFKVPIGIALYQDSTYLGVLSSLDIAAAIILLVVIFIKLNTALAVQKKGEEVLVADGHAVALHYVRGGAIFTDLLTIAPTIVQVAGLLVGSFGAPVVAARLCTAVHWLSVLRLVRLPRAFSIVKAMFVESLGGDLGGRLMGVMPGWAIYAADLVFAMYVLINLMGCLWLFTGITEYKQGGHCWLESVGGNDLREASQVDQYVAAVHFAMTTMATVGYGDVAPTTRTERIIAMIIMAVGLLLFGLIIGAVGALLEDASLGMRRAKSLRKKMNEVDTFATARGLPEQLRHALSDYYNDAWMAHEEVHEGELLKELPRQLRTNIVSHVLRDIFDTSHLFAELDDETKENLAAVLAPEVVLPGHNLCEAGDPADCLWILQSGALEMSAKDISIRKNLSAPAIIGEAAILNKEMPELATRFAAFRAVSKACMLWRLSMDDLQRISDGHPRLREVLMAGLAHSLATAPTPAQDLWRRGLRKLQTIPSNNLPAPHPARTGRVAHSMQDDQVLQRKNLPERIMRVLSRQEPSNTSESGQTQP